MGSFVASPPAATPPVANDAIAGDAWHPPLSIGAFMAAQRLPTQVTAVRAREALIGAIVAADVQLAGWRTRQIAAGSTGIEDVFDAKGQPFGTVAGEPLAVILWRRAVYAYAAADLVETHHDITATGEGRARTEERLPRAEDHLRVATFAIRDLVGTTRNRVRLL